MRASIQLINISDNVLKSGIKEGFTPTGQIESARIPNRTFQTENILELDHCSIVSRLPRQKKQAALRWEPGLSNNRRIPCGQGPWQAFP